MSVARPTHFNYTFAEKRCQYGKIFSSFFRENAFFDIIRRGLLKNINRFVENRCENFRLMLKFRYGDEKKRQCQGKNPRKCGKTADFRSANPVPCRYCGCGGSLERHFVLLFQNQGRPFAFFDRPTAFGTEKSPHRLGVQSRQGHFLAPLRRIRNAIQHHRRQPSPPFLCGDERQRKRKRTVPCPLRRVFGFAGNLNSRPHR